MNKAAAQTRQQTANSLSPPQSVLQRKCACGNHMVAGGECTECGKEKNKLQRKASHQSTLSEVPPIVHEVLNSPGQPLDVGTRAFMEPRFGHDFSTVRVHDDALAAQSARSMGARAWTLGEHVTIRPDTRCASREMLLAHELVHVVQQRGAPRAELDGIEPTTSARERAAESASAEILYRGVAHIRADAEPARVTLTRDTQLDDCLRRFEQAASGIRAVPDDRARVERIFQHFSGVNLRDEDNLGPVSDVVSRLMPEQTLFLFLQSVETDVRASRIRAEEARMQNLDRLLRVPHGTGVGPGLFPQMGAFAEGVTNATSHISASVTAFFEGVVEGFQAAGKIDFADRLQAKFRNAAVLNAVAPGIFAAGAVAGIGEDVWKAIKGVGELITDFRAMLRQFDKLFRLMLSPTGAALGRVAGRHTGKGLREHSERLANENVFRFTFDVGRLIGPTIVYVVLAVLGVGLVELVGEMAEGLLQVLKSWPAAMRIIEKIGAFFKRTPKGLFTGLTEAEIDAALETIETPKVTGRKKPYIGGKSVPTRKVPRLEAADIPLHAGEDLAKAIERIKTIVGRKLSDYEEIRNAWDRARAWVTRNKTLSASNYEELYNAARSRFWQEVRGDTAATRRFADAGFIFPNEPRTAAVLGGGVNKSVPIEERIVSLDHILEKGQGNNWQKALDADNLRFEFSRPNSFREIVQMRHSELRSP